METDTGIKEPYRALDGVRWKISIYLFVIAGEVISAGLAVVFGVILLGPTPGASVQGRFAFGWFDLSQAYPSTFAAIAATGFVLIFVFEFFRRHIKRKWREDLGLFV